MEDQKINKIFEEFNPKLSSDTQFLSELRMRMLAVELVKKRHATQLRHNRIAIAVAAATGFIFGMICSIFLPIFSDTLVSYSLTISEHMLFDIKGNWQLVGWSVSTIASIFISINAYELTKAILKRQSKC